MSTKAAPEGKHVTVRLRADTPKAHALGTTELVFAQKGFALIGMPLEAGEYPEDISVQATVRCVSTRCPSGVRGVTLRCRRWRGPWMLRATGPLDSPGMCTRCLSE